jgi:hypothetical protein
VVSDPAYNPLGQYRLEPARYTCYRTAGPILVDGKLDEPSWQLAVASTPFVDIVTGKPAWFDTRVALLWDDDYLYFGFRAQETDVWGTLRERDSRIWEENDLEVFIGGGRDAYYEFEVNALNTVYEAFWIWKDALKPGSPYHGKPEFDPATQRTLVLDGVGGHVHPRGERWGFLDWDFPGLRTAVHVDGAVNRRDHTDRGWTARVGLPVEGHGAPGRRAATAAQARRRVADRLLPLREDRPRRRGARPVRGLDVEPSRALRFAYSRSLPVRDIFRASGEVAICRSGTRPSRTAFHRSRGDISAISSTVAGILNFGS